MLNGKANLYTRLAAQTRAGLKIGDAFENLARSASGKQRAGLQAAVDVISKGGDLREALEASGLMSGYEIEMVCAGESSGQVPESFEALAADEDRKSTEYKGLMFAVAYPLMLIHLAAILPNAAVIVQRGLVGFIKVCGAELGLIWLILFGPMVGWVLLRRLPAMRPVLDRIALGLPLIGSIIRHAEMSRALRVVGRLYASGTTITKAAQIGPAVCRNAAMAQLWERIADRISSDVPFALALSNEAEVDSTTVGLLSTGEQAGKLDEMFERAALLEAEAAADRRKVLLAVITATAFMLGAGLVAYKVISFFVSYFDRLNSIK